MENMKWYQREDFKIHLIGYSILAVLFTLGIWIVDRKVTMEPIYFFGVGYVFMILGQFIFRNNP